jgi:APA family basic amino acid/polyamine antiporter
MGQNLSREIGLPSATVLVIANMVGTGIFTLSGFILLELQNTQLLLLCWLLGGLFALIGALCYGELGAMFPHAGGEYVYLREIFGPLSAFVSGWISLIVGFSAPIAAAAIAFATYLLGSEHVAWFSFSLFGVAILDFSLITFIAILTVVLLSYVHIHSVRLGKNTQNFLTAFKIFFVLFLIFGGFFFGKGDFLRIEEAFFTSAQSVSYGALAVSLVFISFAYSGYNAASYLGGEIKNPQRNLPLSLFLGTLFVTALYLLLNLVYIYALPQEQMSGMLEVATGAAQNLFGDTLGSLIGIAIALGLLSVVSAMVMAGPRVYYAMAKDGLFFQKFKHVCDKRKTPVHAIILQAFLAIVMIVTSTFETLLIYIGLTLSLSSMLSVYGLMRLRSKEPTRERPYKTPLYPLLPILFLLANGGIVLFSLLNKPQAALYALATIGLGVMFYFFFQNKEPKNRLSKTLL